MCRIPTNIQQATHHSGALLMCQQHTPVGTTTARLPHVGASVAVAAGQHVAAGVGAEAHPPQRVGIARLLKHLQDCVHCSDSVTDSKAGVSGV
jgi:hypothetical protein